MILTEWNWDPRGLHPLDRRHHNTFSDMQKAGNSGCRICWKILQYLNTIPNGFEIATSAPLQITYQLFGSTTDSSLSLRFKVLHGEWVQFKLRVLKTTEVGLGGLRVRGSRVAAPEAKADVEKAISWAERDLKDNPWRVRDCGLDSDHPSSTSDPDVLFLAKRWLDLCQHDHRSCENTNADFYPKRLLDLRNGEPSLVETGGRTLHNPYATLSHCWGQADFLTLMEENLNDLVDGVPLEKLPKSFQDAIEICKWLEIRYLWIDSLCIIQNKRKDDGNWKEHTETVADQDWKEHARSMADIYRNCLLNISIDRASNPHQGAFAERPPGVLDPCSVIIGFRQEKDLQPRWYEKIWRHLKGTRQKSFRNDYFAKFQLFGPLDCLDFINQMPLSRRAWVFQERFMSPRVLHFGTDRIFWECRALCRQEAPGWENQKIAPSEWFFERTDPENLHNVWRNMVSYYNALNLTKPEKDKLVAFASVAQEFEKQMDDNYVVGLFQSELPYSLLWFVIPDKHNFTRSEGQAPSWSWACLNGNESLRLPYESSGAISKILDIEVKYLDEKNKYGGVSSGKLRIKGRMGFCLWDRKKHPKEEHGALVTDIPVTRHAGMSFKKCRMWGYFDTEDDKTSHRDGECAFLLITSNKGLILVKTETKGVYKRTGMGALSVESYPLEKSPERDIIIV